MNNIWHQNITELTTEVESDTTNPKSSFDLFEDFTSIAQTNVISDKGLPEIPFPTRPFREFVFPILK
jgi:hypothetical protein